MFQVAPLAESATFLIYISNHEPQHALLDPVLVPSFAVAIAHPVSIPNRALGGERYPAPVGSHDKTRVQFLDKPRRREAAFRQRH